MKGNNVGFYSYRRVKVEVFKFVKEKERARGYVGERGVL
jgi:hypothetical protein